MRGFVHAEYKRGFEMGRTRPDSDTTDPLSLGRDSGDQRRFGSVERARRRSRLRADPGIDVVDMPTLVGIAKAIEDEAVRRYALLAELMDRRGEPATAAAFRAMLEEERSHVAAVDRWAASVGEPAVAADDYEWLLPADLSSSWDEISGSALLTPYRAFAVAVENEERAFSLYAYLAAHAQDAQIRAEAEKLGGEELRHAALLRRWRRRAYHRERRTAAPLQPQLQIDSIDLLREVLAQHEAAIAATHRALVPRLERAGDGASARLLQRSIPAVAREGTPGEAAGPEASASPTAGAPGDEDPRHLLVDAQKPLEALADVLEAVMATAEGDLFEEAAAATDSIVRRIAQISLRIGSSGEA